MSVETKSNLRSKGMNEMKVKGHEIGRIVAGVGWPGDRPGAIVVVGEERLPDIDSGKHHYHVIAFAEESDIWVLLDKCAEISRDPSVDFVARTSWHQCGPTLESYNQDRDDRGLPLLNIAWAIHSKPDGLIGYHLNNLRKVFRSGQMKRNDLGKTLDLRLDDIGPDGNVNEVVDVEHPAVAALGYAVATLTDLWPLPEQDEFEYEGDTVDETTGY